MCCQRDESPIAQALASGIPNRVMERQDEGCRAALRASRCAQESR
jgi:hypothetical protein